MFPQHLKEVAPLGCGLIVEREWFSPRHPVTPDARHGSSASWHRPSRAIQSAADRARRLKIVLDEDPHLELLLQARSSSRSRCMTPRPSRSRASHPPNAPLASAFLLQRCHAFTYAEMASVSARRSRPASLFAAEPFVAGVREWFDRMLSLLLKTRVVLRPPKPKEFERAMLTLV